MWHYPGLSDGENPSRQIYLWKIIWLQYNFAKSTLEWNNPHIILNINLWYHTSSLYQLPSINLDVIYAWPIQCSIWSQIYKVMSQNCHFCSNNSIYTNYVIYAQNQMHHHFFTSASTNEYFMLINLHNIKLLICHNKMSSAIGVHVSGGLNMVGA